MSGTPRTDAVASTEPLHGIDGDRRYCDLRLLARTLERENAQLLETLTNGHMWEQCICTGCFAVRDLVQK